MQYLKEVMYNSVRPQREGLGCIKNALKLLSLHKCYSTWNSVMENLDL